jgi:acetyl-CoA carboxylase biotin carboxyl carrier protein
VTLTAKDVAEITRLLEASNFDELYLELDGLKLSLRRGAAVGSAQPLGAVPANGAGVPSPAPNAGTASAPTSPLLQGKPPAGAAPSSVAPPAPAPAPLPPASDPDAVDVLAPLLGTFYRAPKPGAPPFVEVGSAVEEDTIIGIIEVMKLMNTVRAGVRGKVTQILSRDGALVEYGEVLIRVGR